MRHTTGFWECESRDTNETEHGLEALVAALFEPVGHGVWFSRLLVPQLEVGVDVDARGVDLLVSEPQRDDGRVNVGLEQHIAAVM